MNAFLEGLFGVWFVDPWLAVLACGAVALSTAAAVRRERRERVAVAGFGDLARDADGHALPTGGRVALARALSAVRALGLVALALACGRPVERVPQPLATRGIDAVLCLDVSSSMAARDLGDARRRLDVAVDAAIDFASSREDDRLALVRFARFGRLVSPPTRDARAVADALARLEPVEADGDEDATGIGLALARSVELLGERGSASRVVVLLTDGLENVAAPGVDAVTPTEAARLGALRGVRLYTILVGPIAAAGEEGAGATATVQEVDALRALTEHTGGRLFEARDAGAVARAWTAIDGLERVELTEPRFVHRERFGGFLLGGLVCVALAALARCAGLEVLP